MLSEHPLFVPFGDEVLAGVVTLPDRPARGMVLLLQGLGASSRAHKYRLWVRLAHRLADRGIATLRMDLPGMGDSTGALPSAVGELPTAELRAMLEVACSAARVDSFALAGQCFGAQAIFELSTDVRCRGVAFILFEDPRYILPQPGAATAPATTERPRQPGWKRALRSIPALRPLLLRVRVLRARRIPWPAEFVRLAAATPSLFLLLRPTARVGEIERAIRVLGRMASTPAGSLAVRVIDHRGALTRMPRETQERMLDEVADWLDRTLPSVQPSLAHTDGAVLAAAKAE